MADTATLPTPVAPPPRKRRFLRKLLRVVLVLFVLLAALAWFAPAVVARTGLLNVVLAKAGADLNGTVTADGASLSWFGPVDLHGVKVVDADGNAVLTAESVSSSRTLYQLLTDRGDLGTFTLNGARVEVATANGSTNVERLIEKYIADATPTKPERTPVKVEVTNGTVVLREAKAEHTLDGVTLTLNLPRSRAEAITLAVAAETRGTAGKLTADAEFLNGGKAKVVADKFAVGHLSPLLHRFHPTTTAEGLLSGDLTATWARTADKPMSVAVDGTASATAVRLAGFGPDVVALQSVSVPCKLSYVGGVLVVEKSKLTCDVGTVEFAGTFDPDASPEALAEQTGLTLKADVDVAKLAAMLPRLLKIKAGTEVRSGSIKVDVASAAHSDGPRWTGTVVASKVEATRNGQPLVWESPLSASFTGRLRADKLPHFDSLQIRSDFLNVNARGEPEAFEAAARADLGKLSAKLTEFVDLGGFTLAGAATVQAKTVRLPAGGFTVAGSLTCDNLRLSDGKSLDLNEPSVTATYSGTLARDGKKWRLDAADVGVTAGTDGLTVKLKEAVADLAARSSGKADATLTGDLARWRSRLGRVIGWPEKWDIGGTGTVAGTVRIDASAYAVDRLDANLTNAKFHMPGVIRIDESQLIAKTDLRFDRVSKTVTFTTATLSCKTAVASSEKVEVMPLAGGGYGVSGTVGLVTNLERLQDTLLLRNLDNSNALRGQAEGKVTVNPGTSGVFHTAGNLTVTNFAYGPANFPKWSEPTLKVSGNASLDTAADSVKIDAARVERDGILADAKGTIEQLSTAMVANLEGTLYPDLQKFEPTLKDYLGKTAQVTGNANRPFRLSGSLANGDLTVLSGAAGVAWQSLKVYGMDVGASELKATLDKGVVTVSPVEATFGGGKVKVQPTLTLRPGAYEMTFAKGKVVENAKLTPAACADAIGYALPAIANVAQADGTFSFDLDDSRIPLKHPTTGAMTGRLTVHKANVSPGPVVTQLLQALGKANTTVNLTNNNVVPIELKNGRVSHRDFTMVVDGVTVRTSGSVGVADGSLTMEVDVPLVGKLIPVNLPPRVKDALAKQTVRIPIAGTLAKPHLDMSAATAQVGKMIEKAVRDTATGVADDFLKKGLEQFLPKK